ncbi:hypothetical protein DMC64_34000 [Amycolatopsis sp. WAC 04197]|uniref:hypothetical protein n=1 Tax=Amycolatopsis sp. WAC 04197 TaxID=2203199 RepID=UPI000F772DAB|nr:hypothetical protein [Amycolatopsis sp. WAC 04197]RSN40779.1 hypothetical protein DMC64_34000 [Amycolatopsis sp. WAC 04197]
MRAQAYGALVEVRWTDEWGLPDHVLVAWTDRTPETWLCLADLVICPAPPDDAWRHAGDVLAALPGALAVIAGRSIRFRDQRPAATLPRAGEAAPEIDGWSRYSGDAPEELSVSSAIAAIRASTRCALRSLDAR